MENIFLKKVDRVLVERHGSYGSTISNFQKIAKRWSTILDINVEPFEVALCLIDLKIIRLSSGNFDSNEDSIIDIAGYAALLHQYYEFMKILK